MRNDLRDRIQAIRRRTREHTQRQFSGTLDPSLGRLHNFDDFADEGWSARGQSQSTGENAGPLTLIVLQATSFCNLDCRYCYLPDRAAAERLSMQVLQGTLESLRQMELLHGDITLLWHLGEPLALPLSYFRAATAVIDPFQTHDCRLSQSFQTNGTLMTPAFAQFALEARARVGVSLDGPAFLHDASRTHRNGKGSHSAALRGFHILKAAGVDPSIIAVVTPRTLGHSREFFEFFKQLQPREVGLNLEETEGRNVSSVETGKDIQAYQQFIRELYRLSEQSEWLPAFREIARFRSAVLHDCVPFSTLRNPLSVISVDVHGNFSTFSPELLIAERNGMRPFVFGNVLSGDLQRIFQNKRFLRVWDEIRSGVAECQSSCPYFAMCGGGTPSNKFYESGRFDVAETAHCMMTKKATTDALLPLLESELESGAQAC